MCIEFTLSLFFESATNQKVGVFALRSGLCLNVLVFGDAVWCGVFRIVFDGEQGIDQGGLTKEYFQLIMKELFDPLYGMFIFSASTQCFWFNRDAFILGDRAMMLSNYEMVGKLVGIAIYNNTILELRFPRVIFKKLLRRHGAGGDALDFADFADFDPEMAKGFEQLLAMTEDDDVEAVYCRNFVVESTSALGDEIKFDLLTLSEEGGGGEVNVHSVCFAVNEGADFAVSE